MAQQRYSSGLRTPKTKGVGQKAKYKAVPTLIDGHKFPSKVEAKRYVELKRQRDLGIISGLKLQPRFKLLQDGKKTLCTYIADFQYDRDGETVIEDVKGVRTDVYVIKRKMMKALLGLHVVEVRSVRVSKGVYAWSLDGEIEKVGEQGRK